VLKAIKILVAVGLLVAVCGGQAFSNGDGDAYVSETHGFRIGKLGQPWVFNEKLSEDGKLLEVSMVNAGAKAMIYIKAAHMPVPVGAEAHRDEKLKELLADAKYSNLKKEQGKIAGEKAHGMSLDTTAADQTEYTICVYYLAKGGVLYSLQCNAPKKDFQKFSPVFAKVLETFDFVEIPEKAKPVTHGLAGRCGTEVEWFTDWEAASQRAQKENKLILVTVQFYGGFSLQSIDMAKVGPFMDPDLIELAKERFIVMQLSKSTDAPFRSEAVYGMGQSTFGKAVLFVTPDGKVVGDTCVFQPEFLYDYARAVLKSNPEFAAAPVPERGDRLERAAAHIRRGELEEALAVLEKAASAEEHLLKASAYRRLRKADEALGALKAALSKKKHSLEPDIAVDEAVILLRTGKFKEAAKKLAEVAEKYPKSERIPEAMYWLGACRREMNEGVDSEGWWEKLVESHPESRWAWKAAANLAIIGSEGMQLAGIEWPDEEVMEALRDREPVSRTLAGVKDAEKEALAFLLEAQREDGSWITPVELGRLSDSSIALRDAKIALCGKSLLAYRSDADAAKAIAKAMDFLLKSHAERKASDKPDFYMDYDVWSDSCMLWFLGECLELGVGDKHTLSEVMTELVKDLQKRQKPGGGWSYYLRASLAQGVGVDTRSISFTTATVVFGLVEAKKGGVAVPDAMLARAVACLEGMRNANGSFTYFYNHNNKGSNSTDLFGSCGRVPVCELALYRCGRSSVERLRGALDIFARYRRELSEQRGKALMHTGRHGQGSHYLMYDYAVAAAAIRELPEDQRAEYRDIVLELVLDARTEAGSYLDTPLLGQCYGTAMALLAFQYLK
jgi:tetratricopeptide (TPR) repeat protein